ncbi:hypothetical protein ACNKHM_20660 [Shigella sonnei]
MSFALENQLKLWSATAAINTATRPQTIRSRVLHRAQTRIQQLEYRLAETRREQLSATRERFW